MFAGTFCLPAAAAIGAGPDEDQAPATGAGDGHAGLAGGQQPGPAGTGDSEPRFSLLETIREYALDRLREGGDWVPAHDRHAAYFLDLAEPAEADLTGPGQLAWLDRLEAEYANLSAALSWLVDHGPLEQAAHLSG